jgi:protein-L-isoaspartate(D-aspartate) O-methyltransferase
VSIRVGDGSRGWADHAPFDGVLLTAAAAAPPGALIEQLKPGGRMVVPVGDKDVQQLSVVEKQAGGAVSARQIMGVRSTQLEASG